MCQVTHVDCVQHFIYDLTIYHLLFKATLRRHKKLPVGNRSATYG
nr:MAG TPA: hypothetical protein [Caudoviricetes sp.]